MFGLVVLTLLALVALIHGAFGVQGARHLIQGFGLARTRWEVFAVSLFAALSFACTMAAWGWGTTLFNRAELWPIVGFGYLFVVPAVSFFFVNLLVGLFGQRVVHGVKAGVGIAIPASTLYYMIYMFYLPH